MRTLFTVSVITLAVIITLLLRVERKRHTTGPPESTVPTIQSAFELGEILYTEMNGDRKVWELLAGRAELLQGREVTRFDEIRMRFFSEAGETLSLTADHGEVETTTKDVDLFGDIIGSSDDDLRIETETLHYDAATRTISTEDPVRISKGPVTVEGIGMKGFLRERRFELLSKVKAKL